MVQELGYDPLLNGVEEHKGLTPRNSVPTATVAGSVFNVCNNVLGAGVLTLPYALSRSSTIPGLVMLTLMAILSAYSFILLCRCALLTRLFTYKDIAIHCFGQRAGILCEVLVCVLTLGSCISYAVLIGDFVTDVAHFFHDDATGGAGVLSVLQERMFAIPIVSVITLLPLCCFRNLDSLKFTSLLGVICILFSCGVVTGVSFTNKVPAKSKGPTSVFRVNEGIFVAIALMSVAFTMHYNALQFFYELKDKSEKKALQTVSISFGMCWVIYAVVGAAGYYTFGDLVDGDVLKSYGSDLGVLVESTRLALACCIVVTFPLPFHACRAALFKIFLKGGAENVKPMIFLPTTFLLLAFTVIIAIFAEDVSVVLSFKGSVLGSMIVYSLPALFYMRLTSIRAGHGTFSLQQWRPFLMFAYGIFYGVCGTVVTLLGIINKNDAVPDDEWAEG